MVDPRIRKLAKLIVNYCVEVKKGDEVVIGGGIESLPLLREIYREVLVNGGYPLQVNIQD